MLNAKMLMLDVELLMLNAIFTPTDIECGILLEPITTKIKSDFPRKKICKIRLNLDVKINRKHKQCSTCTKLPKHIRFLESNPAMRLEHSKS